MMRPALPVGPGRQPISHPQLPNRHESPAGLVMGAAPLGVIPWAEQVHTQAIAHTMGVVTFSLHGTTVLDVDQHGPAGTGSPRSASSAVPGLLAGAIAHVLTPSGGLHAYFAGRTSAQSPGRLSPGLLSSGRYILAPPSEVDGKFYQLVRRLDVHGGGLSPGRHHDREVRGAGVHGYRGPVLHLQRQLHAAERLRRERDRGAPRVPLQGISRCPSVSSWRFRTASGCAAAAGLALCSRRPAADWAG